MDFKKALKVLLVLTLAGTLSGCVYLAEIFGQGAEAYDSSIKPSIDYDKQNDRTPCSSPNNAAACVITVGAAVIIGGIALKKGHNNNPGGQGSTSTTSTTSSSSDIRLKRDIHLLAMLNSGMKIYSFRYLWSDTTYVGVMAQDLLVNPAWRDAVVTLPNGFYAVNYGALGLKMVTLEEWQTRGLASIKSDERLSVTKQPQAIQPAL